MWHHVIWQDNVICIISYLILFFSSGKILKNFQKTFSYLVNYVFEGGVTCCSLKGSCLNCMSIYHNKWYLRLWLLNPLQSGASEPFSCQPSSWVGNPNLSGTFEMLALIGTVSNISVVHLFFDVTGSIGFKWPGSSKKLYPMSSSAKVFKSTPCIGLYYGNWTLFNSRIWSIYQ